MNLSAECHVCHQETTKARVHYGGVSCYSCRAFFRRNTQRPELPMCKNNVSCTVTYKERKQCAACRYQKCLTVGMKQELVLNEDDKKVRFKKLLEKKEMKSSSVSVNTIHHEYGSSPESGYSSSDSLWSSDDLKHTTSIQHISNTKYFKYSECRPSKVDTFPIKMDKNPNVNIQSAIAQLYCYAEIERTFQQRKMDEVQNIILSSREKCADDGNTLDERINEMNCFSNIATTLPICRLDYEVLDLSKNKTQLINKRLSVIHNEFMNVKHSQVENNPQKNPNGEIATSSQIVYSSEQTEGQELLLTGYLHKKFSRKQFSCKRKIDELDSEQVSCKRQSVIVVGPSYKHV